MQYVKNILDITAQAWASATKSSGGGPCKTTGEKESVTW